MPQITDMAVYKATNLLLPTDRDNHFAKNELICFKFIGEKNKGLLKV